MAQPPLPVKRVRFAPFVNYLGEESEKGMEEESMRMDSSSFVMGSNRRSGPSLDLQDMFTMEKAMGQFTLNMDSFDGGSGDSPFALSGSMLLEEDEEDLTEEHDHSPGEQRRKQFVTQTCFDFESDSSLTDLPLVKVEQHEEHHHTAGAPCSTAAAAEVAKLAAGRPT